MGVGEYGELAFKNIEKICGVKPAAKRLSRIQHKKDRIIYALQKKVPLNVYFIDVFKTWLQDFINPVTLDVRGTIDESL
jgi:hypothetical protein